MTGASHPVISNTTPLISLAEIGLLDTLRVLYTEIWIPRAVLTEYQAGMAAHPTRPPLNGLPWITVHFAAADPAIPASLDAGEMEAIALARASSARLILLDEHRGRSVAARLGLRVSGTLGMLLEAKAQGHIPLVRPYVDQMIAQGRHIAPRLRTQVLELAGE